MKYVHIGYVRKKNYCKENLYIIHDVSILMFMKRKYGKKGYVHKLYS